VWLDLQVVDGLAFWAVVKRIDGMIPVMSSAKVLSMTFGSTKERGCQEENQLAELRSL
jgi:hypothetical protein